MSKHVRDYTTVSISNNLAKKIRKVLTGSGYNSMSEFVRDSVRRRLEELEKEASD